MGYSNGSTGAMLNHLNGTYRETQTVAGSSVVNSCGIVFIFLIEKTNCSSNVKTFFSQLSHPYYSVSAYATQFLRYFLVLTVLPTVLF